MCVCGPADARQEIEELHRGLTAGGAVVLLIVNEAAADDDAPRGAPMSTSPADTYGLSDVDIDKIDLCDEFLVLRSDDGLDEVARRQIRYAQHAGRVVRFVESAERVTRSVTPKVLRGGAVTPEDEPISVREGTVLDLTKPFKVLSGAVMLYGPDETRPAFTLVGDHVWPGVQWVPEVWYAEAASNTSIVAYRADEISLRPLAELIRWAVATSGQIWERMLWGLYVVGSVATQEELSAIIGCRRESVTAAMRDFRAQQLIEKVKGRIRLTAKGIEAASRLCSLERDDDEGEVLSNVG